MNQSINIKSEQLMKNTVSLINNSKLPISNIYFIFKSIMKDIENTYYSILNQESMEYMEKTDESELLKEDFNKKIVKPLENTSTETEKENNNE